MAIQFQCPGCGQPVEVDDEWASRPVACPYCRRTVTAPAESTYRTETSPPVASPIAPPPTAERLTHQAPRPGAFIRSSVASKNTCAVWALAMSCVALGCFLAVYLTIASEVRKRLGPSPTQEEVQQAVMDWQNEVLDQSRSGRLSAVHAGMTIGMLATCGAWVAGVVLAVIALQQPARRRIAIAAVVVSGILPLFICSGVLFSM